MEKAAHGRAPGTRAQILPLSLPPIGLSREMAAAYINVSPTKFDEMVKDGRLPKPKHIDARRVWDRVKLELAFGRLPGGDDDGEVNEWRAFTE